MSTKPRVFHTMHWGRTFRLDASFDDMIRLRVEDDEGPDAGETVMSIDEAEQLAAAIIRISNTLRVQGG